MTLNNGIQLDDVQPNCNQQNCMQSSCGTSSCSQQKKDKLIAHRLATQKPVKGVYRMGLDIGSTTLKVVVLDDDELIFSSYQRHNSDIRRVLLESLPD